MPTVNFCGSQGRNGKQEKGKQSALHFEYHFILIEMSFKFYRNAEKVKMELVASDVGACKDTGWPGLPCAGHSWSQLTPIPRAQLSCKFINKIYFININPQPQWSSLRDSWIKGRQHCLVVKGKK